MTDWEIIAAEIECFLDYISSRNGLVLGRVREDYVGDEETYTQDFEEVSKEELKELIEDYARGQE